MSSEEGTLARCVCNDGDTSWGREARLEECVELPPSGATALLVVLVERNHTGSDRYLSSD